MHFEGSVVINQPGEKVFNYVTNPKILPEWQGSLPRYAICGKPYQTS
jgi:uncharacterized protein YndB with AHSA1/START domain